MSEGSATVPARRRIPLVPRDGGPERALVAVIAILAFLAALAAAAAAIVSASAAEWRSAIAREATIQIRPLAGRDLDQDVARAVDIARASRGIAEVRPIPKDEAERLLEPWLGQGLDLSELPVPRMVVLGLDLAAPPDLAGLAARLKAALPGASLDDHRAWAARLSLMASAIVAVAVAIVALILAASAGATAFATRGAIAGHRDVVEVLHVVGATDGYIAGRFARRFAWLGLKGGLFGATAAALLILACAWLTARSATSPSGQEVEALFGSFALGWTGWVALGAVALADGLVAGLVAARAVRRFLRAVS